MVSKPKVLKAFADRLRELRVAAGLTQKEVADLCGWTSQAAYQPYETGNKDPSFSVLLRIAHAIGVSLKEFDQPAG